MEVLHAMICLAALLPQEQERSVTAVACSADGKLFASAGWDRDVKVWDATKRAVYLVLKGHQSAVRSIAFSPDGRYLASGGGDEFCVATRVLENSKRDWTVRIWDLENGKTILEITGHRAAVTALAWTEDGKTLVSGSYDGTVCAWRVSDGRKKSEFRLKGGQVWSIAVAPDGKGVAAASARASFECETGMSKIGIGAVQIWNLETGKEIHTLESDLERSNFVAFSRDGSTLISSRFEEIRLWDVGTGKLVRTIAASGVQCLALSSDGKFLAVADRGKKRVDLIEVSSGKRVRSYEGDPAMAVCLSPDGRTLVVGWGDHFGAEGGGVRFWDVASGTKY